MCLWSFTKQVMLKMSTNNPNASRFISWVHTKQQIYIQHRFDGIIPRFDVNLFECANYAHFNMRLHETRLSCLILCSFFIACALLILLDRSLQDRNLWMTRTTQPLDVTLIAAPLDVTDPLEVTSIAAPLDVTGDEGQKTLVDEL